MSRLVLTISPEDRTILENAAKYRRLPISLWARQVLIEESRSIEHKILCTPKSVEGEKAKTYRWAGKDCTKEEFEAGEKRHAEMLARAVIRAGAAE